MFNLEHHQKIHTLLNSLNFEFFKEIHAYFGGGTQLALQYGEYRLSRDVDFLCSLGPGYRKLRQAISDQGYSALFKSANDLEFPRDIKADQYGIRFAVIVDATVIKFEIIAEGRIELGEPSYFNWCSIPCLNFDDACTEKLLSNADRWADESTESRDLIDLAILRLQAEFSDFSYVKANLAYDVNGPIVKALKKFQTHPAYRKKCFTELHVNNWPKMIDGIDLLATDYGLGLTSRMREEEKL